jgi:hypothetical protein
MACVSRAPAACPSRRPAQQREERWAAVKGFTLARGSPF